MLVLGCGIKCNSALCWGALYCEWVGMGLISARGSTGKCDTEREYERERKSRREEDGGREGERAGERERRREGGRERV
eukprot:2446678-Rhodomonas_salina.1